MKPTTRRERMLVSYASKLLNESFGLLTENKRTGDNNRDGNIGEFITGWGLGNNKTVQDVENLNLKYYPTDKDIPAKIDDWMVEFMNWASDGGTYKPCWIVKGGKVVINKDDGWDFVNGELVYPAGKSNESWMASLLMSTHEDGKYRGMAPEPAAEGAGLATQIKAHLIQTKTYEEKDFGLPYSALLWPAVVQTKKYGFDKIPQSDIIVLGGDKTNPKQGAMGYSLKVGGSTAGQANLGAADYFANYSIDSTAVVGAGVLAFLKQAVSDLWPSQGDLFAGSEPDISAVSSDGLTVTKRRKSDVCKNGKLLKAINKKLRKEGKIKTDYKNIGDITTLPDWDASFGIDYIVTGNKPKPKTLKESEYKQLKQVHTGGVLIEGGGVRKVDRSLADSGKNVKVGDVEGNVTTHIGKALASCAVQLFTKPGSAKDLVDEIIKMSGVFGTQDSGPDTDITYCVSPNSKSPEHPTHVYPGIYIACSEIKDPAKPDVRTPITLTANNFQYAKEDDKNTIYIGYANTALMKLSIRTSSPAGSVFTATATVSPYGELKITKNEDGSIKSEEMKREAPAKVKWLPVGSAPKIADDATETTIQQLVPDGPVSSTLTPSPEVIDDNTSAEDTDVTLKGDAIPFKSEESGGVDDVTLKMNIIGDISAGDVKAFLEKINRHNEFAEVDAAVGTTTQGTLKERVASMMEYINNLATDEEKQQAMRAVMEAFYEEADIDIQTRINTAWENFKEGESGDSFRSFPQGVKDKANLPNSGYEGKPNNVGDMMEWWITTQAGIQLADNTTVSRIKGATDPKNAYNKADFEKVFVAEATRNAELVNLVKETIHNILLLESEGEPGEDQPIVNPSAVASNFSLTDTSVFEDWLLRALENVDEEEQKAILDVVKENKHKLLDVISESRWLKLAGLLKD